MKRQAVAALLLLAGIAIPPSAYSQCWSHYRKVSLSEHLAQFPLAEHERWNHFEHSVEGKLQFAVSYLGHTPEGVEASIPLKYSGEIRPVSPIARQAANVFGGEKVEKLFNHELHVVEQSFDGWVLLQDVLVPHLQKELKKGDVFTGCLVLIGRMTTYQLYIMNEFARHLESDRTLNSDARKGGARGPP